MARQGKAAEAGRGRAWRGKAGQGLENRKMNIRSILYAIARLLGDIGAVKKGRIGRRIGRRVTGRAAGKAMRRLWR